MSRLRSEREEKLLEDLISLTGELARRTNRTKIVEVDLTVAHADVALGLETAGRTYRWFTIEKCDDSLNYKLKQTDGTSSDLFRAYDGARVSQHDFVDILVSNPVGTGACRFMVGYWE